MILIVKENTANKTFLFLQDHIRFVGIYYTFEKKMCNCVVDLSQCCIYESFFTFQNTTIGSFTFYFKYITGVVQIDQDGNLPIPCYEDILAFVQPDANGLYMFCSI